MLKTGYRTKTTAPVDGSSTVERLRERRDSLNRKASRLTDRFAADPPDNLKDSITEELGRISEELEKLKKAMGT